MERHARQIRLAGVGVEGQASIGRASVDVAIDGFAAEVAARYLAGAGVGQVRVRSNDAAMAARAVDAHVEVVVDASTGGAPLPPGTTSSQLAGLDDPAARELAAGAFHALRALRLILKERP